MDKFEVYQNGNFVDGTPVFQIGVKQEDGSMILANEHEQGFMVNDAIIDFWKSCNGKRKITDLVEVFAQQTGLQRTQVEKEVMQLLKQLHEGGLLIIPNQTDAPNVEFKSSK